MTDKVLVTSALPYSNNIPHLGNIVGCVLSADIYARHKRKTKDVLFICGTDEYGTATEVKAKQEGLSCREICDKYYTHHTKIYDWFNISFDHFGKTGNDYHKDAVHEIFKGLYDNGLIIKDDIKKYYCDNCNMGLADRYIKGKCYHDMCKDKKIISNGDQCDNCGKLVDANLLIDPICSTCSKPPRLVSSKHLFLKLDDEDTIQGVKEYLSTATLSANAQRITDDWLKKPFSKRCITRDIKWGVPILNINKELSEYMEKVFYVWFDAPVGYKSIVYDLFGDDEKSKEWWNKDVDMVEFMAKDNVLFHTIIFPSMLIGSKVEHPKLKLLGSTNYLQFEGEKFSKSKSIGIFGNEIIDICTNLGLNADYIRYYLIKVRPESNDSSFSIENFVSVVNADLINNYGNFLNRAINLLQKFYKEKLVEIHNIRENLKSIEIDIDNIIESIDANIDLGKYRRIIEIIMDVAYRGNKFIQTTQPWNKKHSEEDKQQLMIKMASIMILLLYISDIIIPDTVKNICGFCNLDIGSINSDPFLLTFGKGKFPLPFRKISKEEIIDELGEIRQKD